MAKLPPIPTISLDEMWRDLQGRALDLDVVNRLGVGAFHAPGGDPMKTLSTLLAIFRHLPSAEAFLDGMPGKVPSHWWDLGSVEVKTDSAAIFKLDNGREIRATEIKWDREAWNLVFRAPPPFSEQQFDQAKVESLLNSGSWALDAKLRATQEQRSDMSPDAAPDDVAGGTVELEASDANPLSGPERRKPPRREAKTVNALKKKIEDAFPEGVPDYLSVTGVGRQIGVGAEVSPSSLRRALGRKK
jgi:hypothetical protein